MFCKNLYKYECRKSSEVKVGDVPMGESHPIRLQSMVTANTLDVAAVVKQCIQIAKAGADYVRITAPGVREAEALRQIKAELVKQGCDVPLIADIHFNPAAAKVAACYVEKVRINPGNFVDKVGKTDEPAELRSKFVDLLNVCKQHKTALRIGVNHGSLSARMLDKYGDTPLGMVESAMEFLRICEEEKFTDVVVSMKSSNTRVMVYATRLLVKKMNAEGMNFPLHLGVTEAGEGEDGRIKSAVGIGTLLADGLGDTIRVSLTEDPHLEIPVAKKLVDYFEKKCDCRVERSEKSHEMLHFIQHDKKSTSLHHNFFGYKKRVSFLATAAAVGEQNPVSVWADLSRLSAIKNEDVEQLGFTFDGRRWVAGDKSPDVLYTGLVDIDLDTTNGLCIVDYEQEDVFRCKLSYLNKDLISYLKQNPSTLLLLEVSTGNAFAEQRAFFLQLEIHGVTNPVVICRTYNEPDYEALQLQSAADFGGLLIDGFADGVMLSLEGDTKIVEVHDTFKANEDKESRSMVVQKATFTRNATPADLVNTCFGILQASRVRFSKTEFISCPGCGRTLFNLQDTLQKVKAKTSHLKGLKIAVMGCIVNGPGEMADADYGYVGAGASKVSLYKGKECVARDIPERNAVEELIALIKKNGDWRN
ncbi:MAG: (E)-4-hydroxy-3-methylbut-2-enyl-diphosphate synthase [Prevotellaceae bacterium]|jgi:(E)-4-hydroxy-3-methylbut-2-enyl-diphosphate synthase|nr:(E)-4-hydroxy-3-methylbut-2-enyl-diphosphate synthase [Prevotellaceae bacterium]